MYKYNGRVGKLHQDVRQYNLHPSDISASFSLQTDALKGSFSSTPLTDLFFSEHNVNILQDGIRYVVFKKTGKKIDRQSDSELYVVMRSIYLQESINLPHSIVQQVRALNSKVLDYCVNTIVQELSMYESYIQDITTLPTPIPRSINTSIRGMKIAELTEF